MSPSTVGGSKHTLQKLTQSGAAIYFRGAAVSHVVVSVARVRMALLSICSLVGSATW
jgi:hypothetical protein